MRCSLTSTTFPKGKRTARRLSRRTRTYAMPARQARSHAIGIYGHGAEIWTPRVGNFPVATSAIFRYYFHRSTVSSLPSIASSKFKYNTLSIVLLETGKLPTRGVQISAPCPWMPIACDRAWRAGIACRFDGIQMYRAAARRLLSYGRGVTVYIPAIGFDFATRGATHGDSWREATSSWRRLTWPVHSQAAKYSPGWQSPPCTPEIAGCLRRRVGLEEAACGLLAVPLNRIAGAHTSPFRGRRWRAGCELTRGGGYTHSSRAHPYCEPWLQKRRAVASGHGELLCV